MFRSFHDITRETSEQDSLPPPRIFKHKIVLNCNYCDDEFLSETEVELHTRITHRNIIMPMLLDPNRIVCKICFTEYSSQELLLRHFKTEHLLSSEDAVRVEREIFICDICSQAFFNKNMLTVHITYAHTLHASRSKKRLHCPKCNKVFKLSNVWYHFQYHEIQSVSCCPICLKKLSSRAHLREHLKTHPAHFDCTICGFKGKSSICLKAHVSGQHNQQIHKHLSELNHVSDAVVKRCFVPKKSMFYNIRPSIRWGIWKATKFLDGIFMCILCREIIMVKGDDNTKLKEHVMRAHTSFQRYDEKVMYGCICGEWFSSKILLKHHVFKMKGDHRPHNDTSTPQQSNDAACGLAITKIEVEIEYEKDDE